MIYHLIPFVDMYAALFCGQGLMCTRFAILLEHIGGDAE